MCILGKKIAECRDRSHVIYAEAGLIISEYQAGGLKVIDRQS